MYPGYLQRRQEPPAYYPCVCRLYLAVFAVEAAVDIFSTSCAQNNPSLYRTRSSLDGHEPTQDKWYKNRASLCGFPLTTVGDFEIKPISGVRNLAVYITQIRWCATKTEHATKVLAHAILISRLDYWNSLHFGIPNTNTIGWEEYRGLQLHKVNLKKRITEANLISSYLVSYRK